MLSGVHSLRYSGDIKLSGVHSLRYSGDIKLSGVHSFRYSGDIKLSGVQSFRYSGEIKLSGVHSLRYQHAGDIKLSGVHSLRYSGDIKFVVSSFFSARYRSHAAQRNLSSGMDVYRFIGHYNSVVSLIRTRKSNGEGTSGAAPDKAYLLSLRVYVRA